MTTSYTNRVFFVAFSFCSALFYGQDRFTTYLQPQIAVNYKVSTFYSHNFGLENRNYLIEEGNTEFRVRHLHFSHFSNLQLKGDQSIAIGIQYRFRDWFDDGSNELRFTQQFNVTSRPQVVRFGHRFRTEQRITKNLTIHRFRYRFSIDFPLQGERLDVGEPYFVGNLESLLSLAKNAKPEYDKRLTIHLGWLLNEEIKFQFGMEYRIENFSADYENVLFALSSLNFSL